MYVITLFIYCYSTLLETGETFTLLFKIALESFTNHNLVSLKGK